MQWRRLWYPCRPLIWAFPGGKGVNRDTEVGFNFAGLPVIATVARLLSRELTPHFSAAVNTSRLFRSCCRTWAYRIATERRQVELLQPIRFAQVDVLRQQRPLEITHAHVVDRPANA